MIGILTVDQSINWSKGKKAGMGHSIYLIQDGRQVRTLYISYNWSRYEEIFHISDICGHRGQRVIDHLKSALRKLKEMGYEPSASKGVNGWGHYRGKEPLSEEDKKIAKYCMFAYHLERFLDAATDNPDAYWYSDSVYEDELKDLQGVPPTKEVQGEDGPTYSEEEDESSICIPFRHPIDGNTMIRTRAQVLDVCEYLKSNGWKEGEARWRHMLRLFPE